MTKHAIRSQRNDDHAFPVRVKVAVPKFGLGKLIDEIDCWLQAELGRGNFATHGAPGIGCDTAAFYFRTVDAAQSFIAAFPAAKLADGTTSPAYKSAAKPH